ncbi:MBL fold metallo-hydrolase RNA specificity domain-containing protein [Desulfovermiculus halophilus]|uniref:MBL fold metallo-hydrolase RNA specificity domain-containing protein n=1 Tax=Desulfovermiculus halophilus TaxID=339722 RepID=UPI000558BD5E|nr:MBL fold metallo-hydrolase [Desulfovermiculus halophilus]
MLKVTCLGATQTVTGSNFLLRTDSGKKYLVDCGLFQGPKKIERRNWSDWDFDPAGIDALLLTHAHIDHSGRIPKLVKDGFRGRILTTHPTAELCRIMLLDSAHIQEMQAEWESKKRKRQGLAPVDPLYTQEDAEKVMEYIHPVQRDEMIELEPDLQVRFRNAGHILGSSIVELWTRDQDEEMKVIFSGDLGQEDQLIVQDPHQILNADHLFVESTYGDRNHRSFDQSKEELLQAIMYSARAGEKVLIPAFAVERTQEILYILGEFHRQGRLPDIPVFLDSPLAIKATEIFRQNPRDYDQDARALVSRGVDPFDLPDLTFTSSTQESMDLNARQGPAIIIAGNGMCTAGRIVHHLKHNLWRQGCSVVIVGFQVAGSTGRMLVDGAKKVKVLGENISVRAKVFTIGGFSAHADQSGLLTWIGHFRNHPKVYLVHGEERASTALAQAIRSRIGFEVHIPQWKESLLLKPRQEVEEVFAKETGEADFAAATYNSVIDVERLIKELKKKIQDPEWAKNLDEEDLDRLQSWYQDLQTMLGEKDA